MFANLLNNERGIANMTKVTLPREVAEAIELQRGFGHEHILFDIELLSEERHSLANKSLATIYAYYRKNKRAYFSALVNGYKIAMSPEEKLREYFGDLLDFPRRREVLIRTLDILGIQIEGVNA